MPQPNFIYDGDSTQITQDGPGRIVLPFQDKGDTQSWEYHAYFTQRASSYTALRNTAITLPSFPYQIELMQVGSTPRGNAYLIKEEEPQDIGNGWLKFKRIYASVPVVRYEGVLDIFSRQFISTSGEYDWTAPPTVEITEIPVPIPGFYKYEYFVGQYPTPLYTCRNVTLWGILLTVGASGLDFTQPFVADNSEIGIYKSGITYRKTLYGIWPPTST